MPADKFGYKPTPQQMSFANLVLHMTESNNYLCAKAGDVPEPKAQELKETDGKDKVVAALKASFDFCNTAMPKVTTPSWAIRLSSGAAAKHHGLSH